MLLWFVDGLLFGGISLNLGGNPHGVHGASSLHRTLSQHLEMLDLHCILERIGVSSIPEPFHWTDAFSLSRFTSFLYDGGNKDQHLLGQHTVHMSPISTAQLNPEGHPFCLSPPGYSVFIPVLVNGTAPSSIRYSFAPLTYIEGQSGTGRMEHIEINSKELKAMAQARLDGLQVTRTTNTAQGEFDEDDDEDDEALSSRSALQTTESLSHVRIAKPGSIRLERVLDSSGVAAKLVHPSEVTIVPCPTAQYTDDSLPGPEGAIRCAGDNYLDLGIDIRGVPPLSLKWSKDVNGRRETFLVDSIEDSNTARPTGDSHDIIRSQPRIPQRFKVPLSLTIDSLGQVTFILESIIDGLGNVVPLDQGKASETLRNHGVVPDSKTARSLNILARPSISFRNCGPGNPAALLIDSETFLTLALNSGDALDAPWDVEVAYDPSGNSHTSANLQTHTLQSKYDARELKFGASAPGEYTITSIKGKVGIQYRL